MSFMDSGSEKSPTVDEDNHCQNFLPELQNPNPYSQFTNYMLNNN